MTQKESTLEQELRAIIEEAKNVPVPKPFQPDNSLKRYQGPWDRGSADAYYGRGKRPHCYKDDQRTEDLTDRERSEYLAGYLEQEESGDFKKYF